MEGRRGEGEKRKKVRWRGDTAGRKSYEGFWWLRIVWSSPSPSVRPARQATKHAVSLHASKPARVHFPVPPSTLIK